MRKIPTLQECLKPYYSKIAEAHLRSFEDYLKISKYSSQEIGYTEYDNGAKAKIIHQHLQTRLKEAFADVPEVKADIYGKGVFGLLINNDLFIRFNKLKSNYPSSPNKNAQTEKYQNQGSIDGFPEKATWLYGGYEPDKTCTKLKSISIACWDNGKLLWYEGILNKISVEQTVLLFDVNEIQPFEKRVKVKPKNQDTETGTNG